MSHPDVFELIPPAQRPLVDAYVNALTNANRLVNLVSRASVDRIRNHHVAHSLTLARRGFPAGSVVVDWGTGGGLPAVPLAICFPEVEFIAVDSIAKKIRALESIVREVGLPNVTVWRGRAETFDGRANFAVSRATAALEHLWSWTRPVLEPVSPSQGAWRGGLLCLKGGDLGREVEAVRRTDRTVGIETVDLSAEFGRPDWSEKYIVHLVPDGEVRS